MKTNVLFAGALTAILAFASITAPTMANTNENSSNTKDGQVMVIHF